MRRRRGLEDEFLDSKLDQLALSGQDLLVPLRRERARALPLLLLLGLRAQLLDLLCVPCALFFEAALVGAYLVLQVGDVREVLLRLALRLSPAPPAPLASA